MTGPSRGRHEAKASIRPGASSRRAFLAAAAGGAAAGLAGCSGLLESQSTRSPPLVEDRPDAVYVPTHVEGMQMAGMGRAGPYGVALFYSFPHRFWLVTGGTAERVDIAGEDAVHLMASVWDRESGTVLPTSSVSIEVTKDGETAFDRPPWAMLSQNMGVHLGDNAPMLGDGTYAAAVEVDPIGARSAGAFRDRFAETASTSVEFEFSESALDEVAYRSLEDRKGQRDAVSPMGMEMVPSSQVPPAGELPGRVLGEASSGDARLVATALQELPAGIEGAGTYLAVSARTPYNRYPLPFMGLSGRVERGGSAVFEGSFTATVEPSLGYHYGAVVDSVESGDAIALDVGAPPQIARHEGYETAFLDMPAASIEVE